MTSIDFNYKEVSAELLSFIEKSPTSFHAVKTAAELLEQAGFHRLSECDGWDLQPNGKYYVTRNGSSLIAFVLPEQTKAPFRLFCSHTDSPSFKVKEGPQLHTEEGYTKLNVEQYGGALRSPWFDRPLSVAGRVLVKTEQGVEIRLIQIDRDLLMIPSMAIHMNRAANDGMSYNVQTDLCPVFGDETAKDAWKALISEAANASENDILGADLFLYNRQKGCFTGVKEEFIAAPRLDDLQCMYGSLKGFLEAPKHTAVSVFGAFDNEETGSVSRQGAASTFLQDVLTRIYEAQGASREEYLRAIAGSFLISGDNAHALHPSHPEKADPVNRPKMNRGIVIKYNADQKYTSDAKSAAVLKLLCEHASVPYQIYTNRSDMAGGSTLGNISNTQVSLQAVDIGLPQLAMHSPYEMAGTKDTAYLIELAKEFYSCELCVSDEKIQVR